MSVFKLFKLEQEAAERAALLQQRGTIDREKIKNQIHMMRLERTKLRKINLLLQRRISNYVAADKVIIFFILVYTEFTVFFLFLVGSGYPDYKTQTTVGNIHFGQEQIV